MPNFGQSPFLSAQHISGFQAPFGSSFDSFGAAPIQLQFTSGFHGLQGFAPPQFPSQFHF
jgi:hypothetical protein